MKISDFSMAFQQKFDFAGKTYKFSKVDVSKNDYITASIFGNFASQSSEYLGNVMCVLSDSFLETSGVAYSSITFDAGEVVYLSTLLDYINANSSQFFFMFGFLRTSIAQKVGTSGALVYRYTQLAGTFYIFDFNDNPIDM